jgi:hypothetical protein
MSTQKNVGWVRPKAVIHRTKKADYATPTHLSLAAHVAKNATTAITGNIQVIERLAEKHAENSMERKR